MPRYADKEGDRFEFITFHQSYAYEDFVEGIRPVTVNGAVTYEVRHGVLRRLCERARKDPVHRYALFIDEINRGNVAKIFGELITLIEADKRLRFDSDGKKIKGLEVTLPYSGDRFGVPANVDLISTMNTADRSIALLDTALRRRFRFEELMPNARYIDSQGSGIIPDGEGGEIDLRQLLDAMNARLTHFRHRDQTIGHAYFTKVRSFSDLRSVMAREILPLLQEYFYEDWRHIRLVLADQTVSDPEYQLVRQITARPEDLFPSADTAELGESHMFKVTPEAEYPRRHSQDLRAPLMRRLTLRERDSFPIGTDDGLSEAEAAAFARLQPSLPAGSLTWEHRAIRFGPFCGVLRAADVTVELLPKIDDGQDRNEGTRGLLVAMLRTTGNLTVSSAGEATLGQQQMHLLDQFILDFCARVNAALRGGAITHYQDHEENLNALRGRLILTNHLRRNAFDRSHLFCSFDERTIDNPHNRALKAVLSVLRPNAISAQARATVAALLHRFDDVALHPVTPRDIARLTLDRMTKSWEPIFERAKWLLQGLFPDVRSARWTAPAFCSTWSGCSKRSLARSFDRPGKGPLRTASGLCCKAHKRASHNLT